MLYIGTTKFVDDDRFDLLPGNENQADFSTSKGGVDVTLRLRRVKDIDQGNFECQISTEPKLSKIFTLNVIGEYNMNSLNILSKLFIRKLISLQGFCNLISHISVPNVKIIGDPEMHVEAGSSVALRCIVTHAMLRPKFVFWYRDRHGLSNSRSSYAKDSITITDNINEKYDLTVGGDDDIVISDLSRTSNVDSPNEKKSRLTESGRLQKDRNNRFTFWNRNTQKDGSIIGNVNEMDESFMNGKSHDQTVTSILTIHEAASKHSGRYQCAPDNTRPAAINLHVIQG